MDSDMNRRTFVKGSMLASAGAAISGALATAADAPSKGPAQPKDALPTGKIGKLTISRLLLGGNLLTHFTHSRDLTYVYKLAAHYNTEAKIRETLAVAEAHGVNTLVIHTAGNIVKLLRDYRAKDGGKIQWIICPTAGIAPGLAEYDKAVQSLVDAGVDAIYIWGNQADGLATKDKIGLLAKAVELVKSHGVPCGVGGHKTSVVVECEAAKVPNDFYIKTFHHSQYPSFKLNHDSCWCSDPEKLIEVMQAVEKPWIGFKTMAAGGIPPKSAFPWCFKNGADFILAGMFDFEIAEDAKIAKKAFEDAKERERPWRA